MLPVLRFTMFTMKPLVFLSNLMTKVLPKSKESNVINHDEFLILTQQGIKGGVFSEQESLILTNLFMLRKLTVKHIMTPRTVMFALREDTTVGEVLERHPEMVFSRIPVYKTALDDITGFVLRSDILLYAVRDMKNTPLSEFRRPISAVPESISISRHFTGLIKDRAHISLVIDEYGGTAGIVTLEDVIETLIGIEIVDEHDKVKDLQNLARQQWSNRIRKMGLNPADYDFDR
jgi:CBS domain containing-hemolysin-like protein